MHRGHATPRRSRKEVTAHGDGWRGLDQAGPLRKLRFPGAAMDVGSAPTLALLGDGCQGSKLKDVQKGSQHQVGWICGEIVLGTCSFVFWGGDPLENHLHPSNCYNEQRITGNQALEAKEPSEQKAANSETSCKPGFFPLRLVNSSFCPFNLGTEYSSGLATTENVQIKHRVNKLKLVPEYNCTT